MGDCSGRGSGGVGERGGWVANRVKRLARSDEIRSPTGGTTPSHSVVPSTPPISMCELLKFKKFGFQQCIIFGHSMFTEKIGVLPQIRVCLT